MIIGMLPASGKSERINGIPKFCLPINDKETLLEWHVKKMLDICDIVKICTKKEWIPIIENLNLNINLYEIAPSTMNDAILKMGANNSDTVLIGMPDTFVYGSNENFYKKILKNKYDIALGSWEFYENLRGQTAQIAYNKDRILNIIDKDPYCSLPRTWGAIKMNNINKYLDKKCVAIGNDILKLINNNIHVSLVKCNGKFIDVGTFSGIKELYKTL